MLLISVLGKQRIMDFFELQASLTYIVISRPTRAIKETLTQQQKAYSASQYPAEHNRCL